MNCDCDYCWKWVFHCLHEAFAGLADALALVDALVPVTGALDEDREWLIEDAREVYERAPHIFARGRR
jgi:hypothetical protein